MFPFETLTILIFPFFSLMINSFSLIKDYPHGSSRFVILVNDKFSEKLFSEKKNNNKNTTKYFFTLRKF